MNNGENCKEPVDHLPKEYQSLLNCERVGKDKTDANKYLELPWICTKNNNLLK